MDNIAQRNQEPELNFVWVYLIARKVWSLSPHNTTTNKYLLVGFLSFLSTEAACS